MLKKDQEFIDSFYSGPLQEAFSDLTKTQQIGGESFDIDITNPEDNESTMLVFSTGVDARPTPLATALARLNGGTWVDQEPNLNKAGWVFSKYSQAQAFLEELENLIDFQDDEIDELVKDWQVKFPDLDFSSYMITPIKKAPSAKEMLDAWEKSDSETQEGELQGDIKSLIFPGEEIEDQLNIQEVMSDNTLFIMWSFGDAVSHGKFFVSTEDSNPNAISILNTIMQLDPRVAAKIESLTPEIKTSFSLIGIDGYKQGREWSYGA